MSDPNEPLDMNYYRLSLLKEDLAAQLREIHKSVAELKEVARMFMVQHEDFKSIIPLTQSTLKESMASTTHYLTEELGEKIDHHITAAFEEPMQGLASSLQQTENSLYKARKALSLRNWLIGITSLSASLIVALSISYFYLSRINDLTTRQFVKTYKYGLLLKEIWPKLSAKDQKMLKNFLEDKDHKF